MSVVFLFVLLAICYHTKGMIALSGFETPIIGIVAQELSPSMQKLYPAYTSFIAASHVKAVESSAARVVPIPIRRDRDLYGFLLNSINGVVLPGGSCDSGPGNPYYDTVTNVYEIVTAMNETERIPILAVSLGYEFLLTVANNHSSVLKNCSVLRENLPLNFTRAYAKTKLFADANKQLRAILASYNATPHHHERCALEADFVKSSLEKNWTITSLSTSSTGSTFVATVEHKSFPFYGVHFQPEKVAFEWNVAHRYPHSGEALIANRHFYDTLVNVARENGNKFHQLRDERRWLIYNNPVSVAEDGTYQQIYLF